MTGKSKESPTKVTPSVNPENGPSETPAKVEGAEGGTPKEKLKEDNRGLIRIWLSFYWTHFLVALKVVLRPKKLFGLLFETNRAKKDACDKDSEEGGDYYLLLGHAKLFAVIFWAFYFTWWIVKFTVNFWRPKWAWSRFDEKFYSILCDIRKYKNKEFLDFVRARVDDQDCLPDDWAEIAATTVCVKGERNKFLFYKENFIELTEFLKIRFPKILVRLSNGKPISLEDALKIRLGDVEHIKLLCFEEDKEHPSLFVNFTGDSTFLDGYYCIIPLGSDYFDSCLRFNSLFGADSFWTSTVDSYFKKLIKPHRIRGFMGWLVYAAIVVPWIFRGRFFEIAPVYSIFLLILTIPYTLFALRVSRRVDNPGFKTSFESRPKSVFHRHEANFSLTEKIIGIGAVLIPLIVEVLRQLEH